MHNLIPIFDDHSHPRLAKLLQEKAMRCGTCGAPQSSLHFVSEMRLMPRYAVACSECKCRGPLGKDIEAAVSNWNKGEAKGLSAFLARVFGA